MGNEKDNSKAELRRRLDGLGEELAHIVESNTAALAASGRAREAMGRDVTDLREGLTELLGWVGDRFDAIDERSDRLAADVQTLLDRMATRITFAKSWAAELVRLEEAVRSLTRRVNALEKKQRHGAGGNDRTIEAG